MAINPFNLRRAERKIHERTFQFDGGSFVLSFVRPGQLELTAAFDAAEEVISRYLGTDKSPGTGFPAIGGGVVKITPTAIRNAAAFACMQADGITERYSVEEFVAMQVTLPDDTWQAVAEFARSVREGEAVIPPISEAATESQSASA